MDGGSASERVEVSSIFTISLAVAVQGILAIRSKSPYVSVPACQGFRSFAKLGFSYDFGVSSSVTYCFNRFVSHATPTVKNSRHDIFFLDNLAHLLDLPVHELLVRGFQDAL